MKDSSTNKVDIEEIVIQAKEGDEAAKQFILDKYKPLILKLAGKYRIPSYDFEDVVQYGYLTLLKTINMYKAGSNSFNGYAIRAIRNNIMDLFKRRIKIYKEAPDNELLNICVDKEMSIEDHVIANEEVSKLYVALDKLSAEDRDIIEKYYFKGETLKSIATENKVGYKKMVREKNNVLKLINEELV